MTINCHIDILLSENYILSFLKGVNKVKEKEILNRFDECGAIIKNGHFVYTQGGHGDTYINKDAVYPHIQIVKELCGELGRRFVDENVDVVVGPEKGGIILSQWTAFYLNSRYDHEVFSIYAEKTENDDFFLGRGYGKLVINKRVLVVEDTLTTGYSVKKVIELIRNKRGWVVGVSALCNSGDVKARNIGLYPYPLESLIKIDSKIFSEKECSIHGLCSKGVPINTEFGYGKQFLARQQ